MSDTAHAQQVATRPRFALGNNAWRMKRDAVEKRYHELEQEYEAASDAQRSILRLAARHLVDSDAARNATLRVRSSNAAARLLRSFSHRKPRAKTLAEIGL